MVPSPGDVVDELRRLWSITESVGERHRRRRIPLAESPATVDVADHGDRLDEGIAAEELPAQVEVWR